MVKLGIGVPRDLGGGGEHIGRIDAAGEIADHGHVGPEPDLDRAAERRLELIDQGCRVGSIVFIAPIGEVEVPIAPLDGLGGTAVAAEGDPQIVPRQDRLHAFEHGAARAERKEREQVIEAADVGRRRHGAGGEQRLDLGAEIDEVALPRPVERADADAIAREEHDPLGEIEQREGELALQMREQILAVLLVEMHDQLAIAAGAED